MYNMRKGAEGDFRTPAFDTAKIPLNQGDIYNNFVIRQTF